MRTSRWILLLVLAVLAVSAAAFAQAPAPAVADSVKPQGWILKAKTGLALTQSSFTQNWVGSEVGTLSWLASADFEAERQFNPKLNWRNTLGLGFGQTHQQDAERRHWLAPVKSADKIEYDGIMRFTLGQWLDPYLGATLDSQFFTQRPGLGSRALTPLQLSESAGIARAFSTVESRRLVSRLGFAVRQRIDRFVVDPAGHIGRKTGTDGGLESQTDGRYATAKDRFVAKTQLRLFKAFFFSDKDNDPAGDWKRVDVDWKNSFSDRLNKLMSLDLYVEFVYDKQLSKAGQLKQTLGVGLSWQLI